MPEIASEFFRMIRDARYSKELLLFVGSGPSIHAGLPSWNALADHTLRKLCESGDKFSFADFELLKDLSPRQKLSIAHSISRDTTYKAVEELLGQQFDKCNPEARDILQKLRDFPCPIVTTNYDRLIERKNRIDIAQAIKEIEPQRLNQSHIVHIHGSILNLHDHDVILTSEQYFQKYTDEPFTEGIRRLLAERTVLFIGYSLQESEVLEQIVRTAKLDNRTWVFAIFGAFGDNDQARQAHLSKYWESLRVRTAFFDRSSKDFSALTDWLDLLKRELYPVSAPGDLFANAHDIQSWLQKPHAMLTDSDLKELVSNQALARAVFDKVSKLEWLRALYESGLFNPENIPSLNPDPSTTKSTYWPPLIFLNQATKSLFELTQADSNLILKIISETTNFLREKQFHDNQIWYAFASYMPKIPARYINDTFIAEVVQYWLSSGQFLSDAMVPICDTWIPQLLTHQDADSRRVSQQLLSLALKYGAARKTDQ